MTSVVNMICAKNEAKYLYIDDWTGQISLIRQDKLDFRRDAMARPAEADTGSPVRAARAITRINGFRLIPSEQFPK
jgi:hypothetical protein